MIDKPKLTPQSTRMFLELVAKRAMEELKPRGEKEKAPQVLFKFLKKLIVSKAYSVCSSVAYYDIYRANFDLSNEKVGFMVTVKGYSCCYDEYVRLPFLTAYNLFKLLQSGHVMFYTDDLGSTGRLSAIQKMFKISAESARICLDLNQYVCPYSARKLLKSYSPLVHELHCDIELFNPKKGFNLPKLRILEFMEAFDTDSFVHVLKYSVKKLGVEIYHGNYFKEAAHALVGTENLTIEELSFNYVAMYYSEFDRHLGDFPFVMLKSFPNLQLVKFDVDFHDERRQTELHELALSCVKRLEILKNRVVNDRVKLAVEIAIAIHCEEWTPDFDWMAEICKDTAFAKWDIFAMRDFVSTERYSDSLEMTFTEPRCDLKLVIWGSFTKPYNRFVQWEDDE